MKASLRPLIARGQRRRAGRGVCRKTTAIALPTAKRPRRSGSAWSLWRRVAFAGITAGLPTGMFGPLDVRSIFIATAALAHHAEPTPKPAWFERAEVVAAVVSQSVVFLGRSPVSLGMVLLGLALLASVALLAGVEWKQGFGQEGPLGPVKRPKEASLGLYLVGSSILMGNLVGLGIALATWQVASVVSERIEVRAMGRDGAGSHGLPGFILVGLAKRGALPFWASLVAFEALCSLHKGPLAPKDGRGLPRGPQAELVHAFSRRS